MTRKMMKKINKENENEEKRKCKRKKEIDHFSVQNKPLNFLAIKYTDNISFTPPMRAESIWQNSKAFTCKNCLNIIRFMHISPDATPIPSGLSAFAMVACPNASSGDVGSSIHQILNSDKFFIHSIDSFTSHT